jgi:segregation and condensation protein A
MQQKLFDLIVKEKEVSWRTIIYDLVRTEEMNPWDIDISLLSKRYIDFVKSMQKHDLKISGKVLLAAAILLKIKSTHLLDNEISKFDELFNQNDELFDDDFEFYNMGAGIKEKKERENYLLIPKNPQPRKRKVSVNDLVEALQQAMESKKKVLEKQRPKSFIYNVRKVDITEAIMDIYHKIGFYSKKRKVREVSFSSLLPIDANKEEKVYTFIPLLHLENEHKIETNQEEPFSEIMVKLTKK